MSTQKKSPTIYDVARLSGVSIATISRVLNTPNRVKVETRRRVLSAIDDLGFVPKAEARAHALRQTNRIGVITPYFPTPSFVQRLRGIAQALSSAHYELVIYTVDAMDQLHGYLASLPLRRSLDGLIVISAQVDDSETDRLREHGLQTVLIEYPHPRLNSIEIDDIEGGKMVANYLVGKRHRRIAFLGDVDASEFGIDPVSLRLRGLRQGLNAAGLEIPYELIHLDRYSQKQISFNAGHWFRLPDPPTAIFAATDIQAFGALKEARRLGLRVPEEIAIVGFDDLDIAEYIGLTTVSQQLDESGRIAVQILFDGLADPHRPLQHVKIPLKLIVRATT